VVTKEQWREYAYRRGISEGDTERSRQKAFKSAFEHLVQVHVWGDYVWLG